MGSFKEINLSLGLSATVDKSTRGKLLREIQLPTSTLISWGPKRDSLLEASQLLLIRVLVGREIDLLEDSHEYSYQKYQERFSLWTSQLLLIRVLVGSF